jgi:hypothetical protein
MATEAKVPDMSVDCEVVIPFLRSFIRLDDSPEETKKAQNASYWLLSNLERIKPYFSPQDYALLRCIYEADWASRSAMDDFGQFVDTATVNWDALEVLAVEDNTMGILDRLAELRDAEPGVDIAAYTYRTQDDLTVAVDRLSRAYEANHWIYLGSILKKIASGNWTDPISKKTYGGAKGARQYVYEQLEKGVLSDVGIQRNQSFLLSDGTDALIELYDAEGLANHTILTGFSHLDRTFQLKRGQLFGVLGYSKHRKTTLCRSIAYNALCQGFNVLWICIEQTAEEELAAFQVMHTHRLYPQTKISVQKFDRHLLTPEEREDLKNAGSVETALPGRLKIVEPGNRGWGMVEQMIQTEALITGWDVVVIDYLTLIQSPNKDERAGMSEIIKAAKQLGKNLNALVITPIQGNRDGAERAQGQEENKDGNGARPEGEWDKEGISDYSEFSKSCDCIITTWYGEFQQAENEIIIGLLINRRCGIMLPLLAKVDNDAGYIHEDCAEWSY